MILAAVAAFAAVGITAAMVLGDDGRRPGNYPVVMLVYEVAPVGSQTPEQARDRAIAGIKRRLDDRSLAWASVTVAGPSRVRVELGGKDVPFDRMIEIIERSAVLGIHRVVDGDPVMQAMYRAVQDGRPDGITAENDAWFGPDGQEQHEDVYLAAEDRSRLEAWVQANGPSKADLGERRVAYERMFSSDVAAAKPRWRTYLIENRAIIDGGNVAKAEVTYDQNTLRPQVIVNLDAIGRDAFAAATEAALGHKLAIVLDGRVISAPVVQSKIPGGQIVVTMGGGDPTEQEREAYDLVGVLRSGSIPPLLLIERRDVGPSR